MTVNAFQIFRLQTRYHSFVTYFWISVYHENINNRDIFHQL